jgi:hypothetical protein
LDYSRPVVIAKQGSWIRIIQSLKTIVKRQINEVC